MEQQEMAYNAVGAVLKSVSRQRYHDAPATQTGALGNPSTNPKARVTYAASWYDGVGRTIASDQNQKVWTTYSPDGQVKTLVASNSDTGNQQTVYTYGTILVLHMLRHRFHFLLFKGIEAQFLTSPVSSSTR
jgi:hypothetical protein